MSLRINHNLAAVNGHRNMIKNDTALSRSLEKLSSGLKINRAADDAAGLIISEQMRAQIAGLNQAVDNTETAVAMVQTAEGALDEMNTLLSKARELAVHAANDGANDATQLEADQTELDNIINSVTRIANNTQFGTKKLLDGTMRASSLLSANIQTVANFDSSTIPATAVDRLTAGVYNLHVTTAFAAGVDSQATSSSNIVGASAAFDVQAEVDITGEVTTLNGTSLTIGGGSVAGSAVVAGTSLTAANTYSLTVSNGVTTFTTSLAGTGANAVSDLVTAFNTANSANVTVAWTGAGAPAITFAAGGPQGANGNGYSVRLANTTAGQTATGAGDATTTGINGFADPVTTDASLASTAQLNNGDTYVLDIIDTAGTVLHTTSLAGNAAGTNTIGAMVTTLQGAAAADFIVSNITGGDITLTATPGGAFDSATGNGYRVRLRNTTDSDTALASVTAGGATTGQADAVAELRDSLGVKVADLTVASTETDGTIVSDATTGLSFNLSVLGAGSTGDKGSVLTAADDQEGAIFQIGANRDQTVMVSMASMKATDLGKGASDITDVNATLDSLRTGAYLTNGLAQEAIAVIDQAIDGITNQRGKLGAVQSSTLESNLSNLRATLENTTAAESIIRDVDFAYESAIFTKNSILIQASTAMLAQANQLPQNVLQLLG